MKTVLDAAIEYYQRNNFVDEVNAAYARLKADPKAWSEELEERRASDGILMDGIEDE